MNEQVETFLELGHIVIMFKTRKQSQMYIEQHKKTFEVVVGRIKLTYKTLRYEILK